MTGGYVEKSFAPAPADLEAIGAFTRRAFAPEELYVFSVVLCNNDVDRDHEKFTRQALEKLGALFVGKTGIFDHSMKSGDQAARIYATAGAAMCPAEVMTARWPLPCCPTPRTLTNGVLWPCLPSERPVWSSTMTAAKETRL